MNSCRGAPLTTRNEIELAYERDHWKNMYISAIGSMSVLYGAWQEEFNKRLELQKQLDHE